MIEIERKFLVVSDEYRTGKVSHIRQGYICSEKERVVRVRIRDNRAFLTLKNASVGFARNEYEYEIPLGEAEEMLTTMCRQPIVEKYRYLYEFGGRTWEVDEFKGRNEGLVIAELELESEGAEFLKPAFVGEEVTGEARYYNVNL